MVRNLGKLKNKLMVNLLPKKNLLRKKLLQEMYISHLQVIGTNCSIENTILFNRNHALNLGNDVTLKGGGEFDAQAGIMIGDGVTIEKNVSLLTTETLPEGTLHFDPIIIGRGATISEKAKIRPGAIISPNQEGGLLKYNGQIIFVVSTGRSGSKSIADMINNANNSECFHDAFSHFNVWSCDRLYKRRTDEDIYLRLRALYAAASIYQTTIHAQSDQKLGAMIPFLNRMFPEAKFVWLIRDADSFINSAYSRGWFFNREFGYDKNKKEFFPAMAKPSALHAAHRINGELTGHFSRIEWLNMTAFERNCWYWNFWNKVIENDLNNIPSSQWIMIKLNELTKKSEELAAFIGLNNETLKLVKTNRAYYKKIEKKDWNTEMNSIYIKHCQQAMEKWFYS